MIGGYVRGEYVQWKCPDPVHGGSEANCTSRCIYTPGAFVIGRKNTRSCVAPNCHSCLTQTMTSTEQHSPHLGSVSGRSCLHVCLLVTLRENDCSCRHETSE